MSDVRHDDDWMQVLSAYADGECSPAERRGVEAHLQTCDQCCRWLEQARADRRAFTEALVAAAGGVDLSEGIMAEVEGAPAPEAETAGRRPVGRRIMLIELLVGVAILAAVGVYLFPLFSRSRAKARQASCLSNVKQLLMALKMYAEDYDETLPDADRWEEQTFPYTRNRDLYKCPYAKTRRSGYAMNPRFSGARITDYDNRSELVLVYDADENGRPVARHDGGLYCGYMDGHAKYMKGIPDGISMTTGMSLPSRNYGLADRLKLAYAASAELWVKSVYQATLAAERTFAERGGFVLRSDLQAVEEPYRAKIVGRVPTEEVANTINALGDLGWVARREIYGEDLTRQYLDRKREVRTSQQRQERLKQVVRKSSLKKHVVQAEEHLAQTEAGEDKAESELYRIADRTTLATVTATLTEKPRDERPLAPLAASWQSSTGALKALGIVAARVGIWLAVFAWVWGPLLWIVLHVRKRRRQSVA